MCGVQISEIQILPVIPKDGLLAFASFIVNGSLFVGNIAIRTRPDGAIRLLYPHTILSNGKKIHAVHPITKSCGDYITSEVVYAYNRLTEKVNPRGDKQYHDDTPGSSRFK